MNLVNEKYDVIDTVVFLHIVLANSIFDMKMHHMNKWKRELSKKTSFSRFFPEQKFI